VVGKGLGREGRRKEEEKEVVVRKRRVDKVFIPLCLCVYVCVFVHVSDCVLEESKRAV
jgi:hypothetical protein